jgi:hypothetical protein
MQVISVLVLSPGIDVSEWFLSLHVSTAFETLVIIGIANVLVYWIVIAVILEVVAERRQVLRSFTPKRAVAAPRWPSAPASSSQY